MPHWLQGRTEAHLCSFVLIGRGIRCHYSSARLIGVTSPALRIRNNALAPAVFRHYLHSVEGRRLGPHARRRIAVIRIAFLIAMLGAASGILGGLYYLFRDDHSDEAKKSRKRLLVSNWK